MKKKLLALVLVVVLALTSVIGGTMAYLTDTDDNVNVMTLGNVYIEQIEQEWNDEKTELVDFTQGKPLYPYVGELGWENKDEDDGAYRRFTMNNVVDKYVSVENIGKSDAYIRTFIALEMGDYAYDQFNMVGVSINKLNGDEFKFSGAWEWTDDFTAEIDGHNYNIMVAVHKDPVKPGETTIPSLLQVYLSKDADNEEVEKLDGNKNGTYDILVFSQAVQTEGFADAETALNIAFGNTSEPTRYHPWVDGVDIPAIASTSEELAEVLSVTGNEITLTSSVITNDMPLYGNWIAENPYTINGNGKTVTMVASDTQTFGWTENGTIPLMANIFSSETGALVTVNDLTITGTMQSVMAGNYEKLDQGRHNTVFNNVNIVDAEVVSLSAGISPALSVYGTLTMNNCNVYGSTLSPLDTEPMWPVYDMAVVNFSNTTINGGKVGSIYTWAKAALTIKDAEIESIISACRQTNDFKNGGLVIDSGTTVDKIEVTNAQGVLTIKEGAVVNNLDLTKVTIKTGITIEDGATVKNITVNGETVDFDTWKNS